MRYWLDVLAAVDTLLEKWAPLVVLVTDSPEEQAAKMAKKREMYPSSDAAAPSEKFIIRNILRNIESKVILNVLLLSYIL